MLLVILIALFLVFCYIRALHIEAEETWKMIKGMNELADNYWVWRNVGYPEFKKRIFLY